MVFKRADFAKTTGGFTLLEVMIAVSVLSIGFFAIYSLFLQSVTAAEAARFRQQAVFLSTLKEATWAKGASELSPDAGDFGDTYPGWRWRLTPSTVTHEEFESVAKRLKRVDLEVFQEGSTRLYSATHYLLVEAAP